MDTVILAAGKGSRLDGIVPPYHKPLVLVNGEPLVRTQAQRALRASDGQVFVVVAPENALPISSVLPNVARVSVVVQRHIGMEGPGLSLHTGLGFCDSDTALVLMADNVTTYADLHRVATTSTSDNVISVSLLDAAQAERFTRLRRINERTHWVEKTSVTKDDLWESGMATCWVGPLRVNVDQMRKALEGWGGSGEAPIGPMLNGLDGFVTVATSTIDIGVPEALA